MDYWVHKGLEKASSLPVNLHLMYCVRYIFCRAFAALVKADAIVALRNKMK